MFMEASDALSGKMRSVCSSNHSRARLMMSQVQNNTLSKCFTRLICAHMLATCISINRTVGLLHVSCYYQFFRLWASCQEVSHFGPSSIQSKNLKTFQRKVSISMTCTLFQATAGSLLPSVLWHLMNGCCTAWFLMVKASAISTRGSFTSRWDLNAKMFRHNTCSG